MVCLSQSAFEVLRTELQRRCAQDPAGQIQHDLALKRLEKLCQRPGTPYTREQLRDCLSDLFPDFDERVLQRAARMNQRQTQAALWGRLKWATIAVVGLTGGIWFLNLPYPMIRYPVAKTMPFLLLPSFISMDYHYRQAIATTEQADQLVNQATSSADIELGATKVKTAQSHLDALPVWFLGYYPSVYCGLFSCGWRFTLDEFKQARQVVARMDATVFQERNALTQVATAESAIALAKQKYQQPDASSQQSALAEWQQAMDTLRTVSGQTFAGRIAQTKLQAFERDFQQKVGFTADNLRAGSVIQSAKLAAESAELFSRNLKQTVAEWEEGVKFWEDAITQLSTIKVEDPDYLAAQKLKQIYNQKLSQTRIRLQAEAKSVQAYQRAEQMTQSLIASVPNGATTLSQIQLSQVQAIVDTPKTVSPNTTVYDKAQTMLKAAQQRLPN